jgi:hypothetical protein
MHGEVSATSSGKPDGNINTNLQFVSEETGLLDRRFTWRSLKRRCGRIYGIQKRTSLSILMVSIGGMLEVTITVELDWNEAPL